MDDGSPTLGVGFAIDTEGAFSDLLRFSQMFDDKTLEIVRQVAQVEKATAGMMRFGPATAAITSFGNASTRELQSVAREAAAAEKAGEALSRQLEKQAATFGLTATEIRKMKVEAAALRAEQAGNTDLAARLIAQEQALYDKEFAAARRAAQAAEEAGAAKVAAAAEAAAALKAESEAARRAAAEHAELARQVRASHDAQVSDAAAAERMRESTDPLYAAIKRLNAEIEESTRLYRNGATAPAEYARQQEVLQGRLKATAGAHETMAVAGGKNAFALRQVAIQIPDIVQGLLSGQHASQVFIQQGGQIAQIGMMAEGGLKRFAGQLGAIALRFAPAAAAAGIGVAAFGLFARSVEKGVDTKALVNSLGLTHDEIKRLKDTSVTTGDVVVATFEVMAKGVGINLSAMGKFFADAMDYITTLGRKTLAGLYAAFLGTFKAIAVIVEDVFAGKGVKEIIADTGKAYTDMFKEADSKLLKFGRDVTAQVKANKLKDLNKQAAEIKADRTPKTDAHAAQLAREAEATEAQIKNLYRLADAYGVSGAAALIAEARVKAESQAIKQRADIEAAVDRQIRLAIATRVSDAAKSAAGVREQADAQERANAMVEAGILPASMAAEYVKNQIADLPLLAAVQVAQQRGLATEAARATAALNDQRAARLRLANDEEKGRFEADKKAGENQIAMLQEQLRLVGATENARVHALAVLKATQEAEAQFTNPSNRQTFIDQQVEIADTQQNLTDAIRAHNEALTYTADIWDRIASNVQAAANGMSDAFGASGKAIGDITAIYASYRANEEQLKVLRKANADSSATQAVKDRRDALLNLKSSGQQIEMYGDMAAAAKGFFNEKSAGYKALQAAEMAFRAVQLAMSIASMFQDTAETASHVANAGARATANAAEGVSAQAKLPFPANIAAMAATAAAIVAFGISMLGGRGGGASIAPTSAEDLQKAAGTGTILGSPNDKSASIAHSLDLVAKNTDGVLQYNNQMLSALKSIDASIGAMAATVAKQINVSGSLYDTTKLNLGSSGSAGFLGLFSSSTTRSLYDAGITLAATTVGDIVARGISGNTYQVVEQVKKSSGFLGIGGGTKTTYQTTNGALPSDVAASIQSVIGALENGIVTAAGAIGINGAKAMLDNISVSIGQLSFKGLDAQGIEDQLNAVFSSVGDQMVSAILPDIAKFQKVGEGLFETLERVASTVVAVDATFQKLGRSTTGMGIDIDMAVAGMFDSVSDFTSAADTYFQTYYSSAEQTAAKTAQLTKVFDSLGLTMPNTLAAFRALVDAQDLTTAAGQSTYATLLKLAPAFADLQSALSGAKSAADIASERADLQRQLLQLQGDTAALRALDLAKLDPSNRALQQQIYDLQDAQDAAKAAKDLADAWKSVGDSIMDEVKRIRGLSGNSDSASFASLLGQFNAATTAARAGDQDAAKSLPGLSQSLLKSAQDAATSRQELARIQAQTATSLEATYAAISGRTTVASTTSSTDATLAAIGTAQSTSTPTAANDDGDELAALRDELAAKLTEMTAALAAITGNTAKVARTLDNVTSASGGDAVSVAGAA